MMGISFAISSKEEVDAFLEGCKPGTDGCTEITLTNLQNAELPTFAVPKFNFDYLYCTDNITNEITYQTIECSEKAVFEG